MASVAYTAVDSPVASRLDHPPRLDNRPGPATRWLSGLALTSAVAVYGLIIFGSHVRVTESGMGCPDWPLCHGEVGPIYEFHTLMEQTHRYLAAVLTVLVLATAALAMRTRARPATVRPALFTLGVIVVQIALGALTVFAGNGSGTVVAHLLAGLSLLGGATVTAVCAVVPRRATPGPRLGRIGWLAIGAAAVLFLTGSLVVEAEAEQACASFPLCPPGQPGALVSLHLLHRGVAALAGAAVLIFAIHAWRRWAVLPGARALAATLATLILATATLGVVSALLKAPPAWQNVHLAGAAAVIATSVALAALGWLTGADCSATDRGGASGSPGKRRRHIQSSA